MKTFLSNSFKGLLAIALFFSTHYRVNSQTSEAIHFDGSDDRVVMSSFSFGNNWTAEAWINPDNVFPGNWSTVLSQSHWDGGTGFAIAVHSGSVFFTGPSGFNITTPITVGVWTHVAATYNNGIYAFYKNGLLVGTQTATFTNASRPFYIAARDNNDLVTAPVIRDHFQGKIDEVRIWNVTRSQCDIQRYMNCEIAGAFPGLVANYHFSEGVANGINFLVIIVVVINNNTLTDYTGNGHTGTLTNFGLSLGGPTSNWILSTCPAQGLTVPAAASTSEIDVLGNGNSIVDGTAVTSATNHTDFNGAVTRTFVIQNTGTQILNVGTPVITGPGANQFSVTVLPANSLAALTGTTSFVVAFTPTSLGVKNATVNIYNLDCSEPFYDFVITATAVTASALNFDGINDYISLPNNSAGWNLSNEYSIELWVKPNSTANQLILYSGYGCITCPQWVFSIGPDLTCSGVGTAGRFVFLHNASGVPNVQSNSTATVGAWTHVAITNNGSVLTMYINGVAQTQTATVSSPAVPNTYRNIGGDPGCGGRYFYSGELDEFRIWNKALCQTEITNYMNCQITTTATGLTANYHFNTGIALANNSGLTTLQDASSSSINGNLNNFALTGTTSNWVEPGGVVNTSTCTPLLIPDITILGNSNVIPNHNAITSSTNATNYGSVAVGSSSSNTFLISNFGAAVLNISSYTITGSGAANFSITSVPPALLGISNTTNMVITFSPQSLGLKTATISINNDDCHKTPYTFVIEGTGVPAAAALNFDGTGDGINTTDPVIGLSDFTIEGWIKPNSAGYLVSTRYVEGFQTGYWYVIGCNSAGHVGMEMAECGNGGSNYVPTFTASPGHSITPGTWGHFAIVRSGSIYSMYINGNLSTTFTEIASHNFDNVLVNPMHILNLGGWTQNGTNWFNGSMDELRIWKTARTQCEIQSFMNCEIPTTATNLVSNYHFNQGADGLANPTINRLTDASASAYSGTLNASFALTGTTSNWVAPGGVTSGNTASVAALIEIDVLGNGVSIPDGSTTASTTNFTDFNGLTTRTFVIQNTVAGGTLVIGTPTIVGTNANQFSVTTLPATSISGIGSTTFVLSFFPNSPGIKNATVNISSNDCNESLYDFVITATAVTGAGLHFDGINDNATVASGINLNNQSFTIEFWAKRTGSGNNMVAGQGPVASDNSALHIGFRNAPGNEFTFAFYNNDINFTTTASTDGNYHHWACVYDASAIVKNRFVYLDGILVFSDLAPTAFLGTGQFVIGDAGYGGNPFAGYIDELRVWSSARTQCQIQTYMNCEIAGSQPSLTANYHFNQGVAAGTNTTIITLIDDNTTPKNATLNNFGRTGSTSNFIIPGGVTSGSTTPNVPTASLTLSGNGNNVPVGVTTSTNNFTDFGTNSTRTFVITNPGAGSLYLTTGYFTGANATNFVVSTTPSSTIAGSTSSSLVITFAPTALGTYSAILNIVSSDCTNPTYSFVITASASPASALAFDGSNDQVLINNTPALDNLITGPFSFEAWVNPSLSKNNTIISKGHGGYLVNGGEYIFQLNSSNQLAFFHSDLNGWKYSSGAVPLNAWSHVAVTFDGSYLKFYINGLLDATTTCTASLFTAGNNSVYIGRQGYNCNCNFFQGGLDEIRIWTVPRSECEIQDHMNCEIPTTATGLVANYHFNQGISGGLNTAVSQLIDAAGANTGTLTNFNLNGLNSNWVAQGAVTSASNCPVFTYPDIAVQGSTVNIINGSTFPNPTDFTQFNNAFIGSYATRTFVISNTGTSTLTISNYSLSGVNASDYTITAAPNPVVAPSGSTSIIITFTPATIGLKSATVNIISDDCDESPFTFAIESNGIMPAAALDFDGLNDYVDLGSTNNLKPPYYLTVEAWVNSATWPSTDQTILGNTENAGYGLFTRTTGMLEGLVRRNGTFGAVTVSLSTLSAGWHHVAMTYDGQFIKLYVDGVLKSTDNAGGVYPITYNGFNNTLIGGEASGGSAPIPGWYFTGKIDEVRIWDIARTQCDIQSYMNTQINGSLTGLQANYHFNEGLVNWNNIGFLNLPDDSGTNTGTLTGFALTGTVSTWVIPGAVISGLSAPIIPTASITVSGNANTITNGSTLTSTLNFTDFGTSSTRTFVIQNTGTGTLYVNSPVILSGANSADFSVTVQPSSSITTGTTNFIVSFIPTAIGTKTAMITVNSSDCSFPDYSFVITASATVGEAVSFDGVNDFAFTPVFNTQTNNITLQSKVYWSATSPTNQVIVYNGNTSTSGYGYFVGAGSSQLFMLYGGITTPSLNYSLIPNQWTYLSLVIETNKVSFYANGVLTTTFNPLTSPNTPTNYFCIGGNDSGSENFNGKIDEVLLWNRALTQCEIQAYQTCEIATSSPSLVANYHFNQGIANGTNTLSTLNDASGNNNNLTLTNFALNGLSSNWVSSGAVISGSSCPAFAEPDINVLSNAINIPDGNTLTATTDNTDFAAIATTSVTVKSYTIQNTGTGPLTVNSITMAGADASMFIIGALTPASPIAPASSAVFSVTFAPTSVGTKTATVIITNNDCDESPYDFVLSGSANVGAAISFNNSTGDYVNCGNILTTSYTKEAWIKIGASSNGNNILSGGSGSNGHALWAPGINLYKLSAGHDLNWAVVQDPTPLSFNVWYHVAVTYDALSNEMTLYKNGVSVSNNTVLPFSGTDPLSIGGFGSNFTINGSMDEVRIWNRALCASEILNNMNCEIPTTANGLIANYHFNQGIGYGGNTTTTLVTDVSGSANTGTLVNFAATGTLSNWVPTSTITTGSSCVPITIPEINVIGNGLTINDGATTATISNHTDFGGVCVNGQVVRTFTIQNTGSANLTVSSITVGGVNASLSNVGPLMPVSPILPNNSAVFSVTFAPNSSGVKTTTLYITNNDCNESSYDFVMTGTCNPLPIVTAGTTSSVVCDGYTTTLNGGGADTYTWTGGVPTVTNGISFTPTATANYTVAGTNTLSGCTSTNLAVQTITVNPSPTITASTSSLVICDGEVATITTGGASNYSVNTNGFSGSSTTVSPQSTAAYSVTGTSSLNCLGINTVVITITVNPLPIVTATASSPVICNTATTSLIGGGADTYTWTGGAINGTAFSPTQTATYSVTGSYTLTGCTSTNAAAQTITVDATPTITANSASTVICEGISATLTASGASTYTWNPGGVTTTIFNPTPSLTTTYSVMGTSSAGCTSTNTALETVSVNPTPTVSATISNSVICNGATVTVNGSGAQTYSWTGGVTDATAFTPSISTTYSVTGTNSAGCTSTNQAVVSLTVNALPTLTINSTKPIICLGENDTLSVSGAQTYDWTNGSTSLTIIVSPSITTNYTVTGKDLNGCINTAVFTQSVLPCSSDFTATASIVNVTCKGKDDGQISIDHSSSINDGEISYVWSSNASCLENTCDTVKNLKGGTYSVTVILTYTVNGNFVKTDSVLIKQLVVTDDKGDCVIKVFNGVTANGDGVNDFLVIENIEEFPNNKVTVFNRWGQQVFQTTGYNNVDKVWPTKGESNSLPSNTYFYIIDLGTGGSVIKGWVELIQN